MNFALIEDHPWVTTAVVLGGAIILYLVIHRSGGGDSGGGAVSVQSAGVDPNAAAAGVASQQIQAQLAGLQIQSGTQVQLKQLDVSANQTNVSASQDVTNRQTDAALALSTYQTQAQLSYGLASQQSQVELARIGAGVQLASIDAIERAYGVLNGPTGPSNTTGGGVPISAPVVNVGGASPQAPPTYVTQAAPALSISSGGTITPDAGLAGKSPYFVTQSGPTGAPLPSGSQINVPLPNYPSSDPTQYPGTAGRCSPLDADCVNKQSMLSDNYHLDVAVQQVNNNVNQCYANGDSGANCEAMRKALYAQIN